MEIRNIAIIAHVDHGKTSITDALMRQTGATTNESVSMDSNALEKERGITIYSKNAAIEWGGGKINIMVNIHVGVNTFIGILRAAYMDKHT